MVWFLHISTRRQWASLPFLRSFLLLPPFLTSPFLLFSLYLRCVLISIPHGCRYHYRCYRCHHHYSVVEGREISYYRQFFSPPLKPSPSSYEYFPPSFTFTFSFSSSADISSPVVLYFPPSIFRLPGPTPTPTPTLSYRGRHRHHSRGTGGVNQ